MTQIKKWEIHEGREAVQTMTDLEITKACANAMGFGFMGMTGDSVCVVPIGDNFKPRDEGLLTAPIVYSPLTNDAQAMALVKKLRLTIGCTWHEPSIWTVTGLRGESDAENADLNRAICECVAKLKP